MPDAAPSPAPLVIAHRGASGHLPEHTLEAYRLAAAMGADYLEPDLVATRDGVLVARHENEIGGTTDVADRPEFAARRATKVVDGLEVTGWFTEDFTFGELRTLRAREQIAALRPGGAAHDGRYRIPSLDEIIRVAREEGRRRGRVIGIYPETKHPSYFREIGLPLEEPLLAALEREGWTDAGAPVFIQSFEVGNLRMLRARTGVRLVQLLEASGRPWDLAARNDPRTYAAMCTPAGLREIAGYADAVGPAKGLIVPRGPNGRSTAPTSFVADAHAAGLQVHPWTFRSENHFLPAELRAGDPGDPGHPGQRGDPGAEYASFYRLGVDGVFTDHPDDAVAARAEWEGAPS